MAFSLLGIALLNTIIGIENINKNTQQYSKQRIANAKIDRILEMLEAKEINKLDLLCKYIEKVDTEIAKLVEKEGITATTAGERDLYYLFENRKNVIKWAEERNNPHNTKMELAAPFTAESLY